MTPITRRDWTLLAASLTVSLLTPEVVVAAESDDMTVGSDEATLHLVEYASATCPHCARFHMQSWPILKSRYIDAGRLKFTFREIATPPVAVALGMFQLSRCGGPSPDEYLRRVGILFERQSAILGTGTMLGVRDSLLSLGREWGLTGVQVMGCLSDPEGARRIVRSAEEAARLYNISSTPSFVINGARVEDPAVATSEGMIRILNAALGGRARER